MKKVVILGNLGSPDSPTTKSLRAYLSEFLMDERVIDIPKIFRSLLVKGIISPFRSPVSAKKYQTIWTQEGSPLVATTRKLSEKLAEKTALPVYYVMRYGNPNPNRVYNQLLTEHPDVQEIIYVPLYPHYAMSSYETAVEQVKTIHQQKAPKVSLRIIPPFYKHESYIQALAASIQPWINQPFEYLLFSYHGIPERHIKKTDPTKMHCLQSPDCCNSPHEAHSFCYRHQVYTTTKLVAQKLGIGEEKYGLSFQSRLGSDAWLKPYTGKTIQELPQQGIKNLLVVCPAFVSDCLETLEEINVEGKEIFEKSGGKNFTQIPCLNTQDYWIACLETLINTEG